MAKRRSRPKLPYSLSHISGDSYKVTISCGNRPDGSRRRLYATVHAPSEREAHARAAAWAADARRHSPDEHPQANRVPTVREWAEVWMATYVERELAASTAQGYRGILRNRILPAFEDHPIDRVTPRHVADWLVNLDEPGVRIRAAEEDEDKRISRATQLRARSALMSLFQLAVDRHLIPSNPVAATRPPRHQPAESPHYQADDIARLLTHLATQPARTRALVYLGLCGLRRGELAALEWGDIDLEAPTLRVARAAVAAAGFSRTTKVPKSASGKREIPLPAPAVEALLTLRSEWDAIKAARAAKDWPWRCGDRVFIEPRGRNWSSAHTLSRLWEHFVAEAQLPPLGLHGLRHTAASILLAAGVPVPVVAAILGHSPAVLLRVYAHLMRDTMPQAVGALNDALSPRLSPNPGNVATIERETAVAPTPS